MTQLAVGKRYARAILVLATEQGQVETAAKELAELSHMWSNSHELRELFRNPSFTAQLRKATLSELLVRTAVSTLVKHSVLYLADCGRMAALPDVSIIFAELASRQAGTVRAIVASAGPLSDVYYSQLQRTLERATGKKVSIEKSIDPSLIAGVVTRVGDQVFDGSIRTRLLELTDALRPL